MLKNNLFSNLISPLTGENFSEILNCENVIIERIVSSNKPDSTIYNQEQNEWVILLQGEAKLELNNEIINLNSGDYIFIPRYTPHQVISTSDQCVWLAIHIYPQKTQEIE
jgi:cupin 2 domain-containing protein